MRKNIYKFILPATIIASLMVSGCNQTKENTSQDVTLASDSESMAASSSDSDSEKVSTVKVADYEDEDFDEDFDIANASIITLSDTITSSDNNVTISDNAITISAGGTYILTGSASTQIIVDSKDDEIVKLVLQDVSISCDTDSPIYVENAKKTILTLASNTTNTITDSSAHEESTDENATNTDAAIYSKDPITINGNGTLDINCTNANGITSKDYLVITNGNININAGNNGIKGKDYVLIKDGNIVMDVTNDGIKSTNSKDTSLGYVNIDGGNITIDADGDCIQAETDLYINGGTFSLTTADGNYEIKSGDNMMGGNMPNNNPMQMPNGKNDSDFDPSNMPNNENGSDFDPNNMPNNENGSNFDPNNMPNNNPMQMPSGENNSDFDPSNMPNNSPMQMPNNENNSNFDPSNTSESTSNTTSDTTTTSSDNSTSQKGLKATCNIVINDGTLTFNTADDAIHSNQTVTINNTPTIQISTGDDGIHADKTLTINNGSIDIAKCYEGLEACDIIINDGNISIVASDDGINASDGSETSSFPMGMDNGNATLTFNGGNITVNASGDGLDSNGYIYQNGGNIIVNGPTSDGDGALDYDKEYIITGGTLIAAGSSRMAQNVSNTSTQNAVIVYLSQNYESGKTVTLVDETGNEILTFTPEKSYNCLQFSTSDMKTNNTYKVLINGNEVESFSIENVVNSVGTATNTMGGGFGNGRK